MNYHLGTGFARTRASLITQLLVVIAALLVPLLATQAPAQAAPGSFDLIAPANAAWCTATCTFRWAGGSSAASYQLYVDGVLKKDAISVSAPSYTLLPSEALTDGFHSWYVVALDGTGGTTQSTSTWSARVEVAPPAAFTLLAPLADAWVSTDTPTFSWNGSSDSGSGLARYEVWIDGAAQTTTLGPTALSSSVPIPQSSIFLDNFDSCDGWAMAKIPPSAYNWTCTYQSSIDSTAMSIYALATSGTIGSIATSGVVDLSNVGPAQMALHGSNCGAQSFQITISDGSVAGFRFVPWQLANCAWTNLTFPIDDFTGGSSSAIQITGVATAFNSVSVDSIQILGAAGGSHTWQVVAVDAAGNRTPSESRQLRYDLPPAPFDLAEPTDSSWTTKATPTFTWNATTDAGSGLAKYQVWIDGSLAIDNVPATATTATATTAVTEGVHKWQVYAVDSAGAVRHSRETWALGVDLTPPMQAPPFDLGTVSIPTPLICWWTSTDTGGSGLDHYSLAIDGVLSRDKIKPGTTGTDCATPMAALPEGKHTLLVTAYDTAGNAGVAAGSLVVDFSPPAAFALTSPAGYADCCGNTIVVVDTLTPTFVWQASSSSGSGLDHYEIHLDGASACSICNIPPTATSAILANSLYPEQHYWEMVVFDRLGGSTRGYTPNNQGDARAFFTAKCTGACLSAPEPGPEPAPEPARDGGIDAPMDAFDGPTATATSTSTATGTLTMTGTATATSTSTASATSTSTSVVAEPRPDGAVMADAGTSDTAGARDALRIDSLLGAADAWTATPSADATSGLNLPDGGLGLVDALVVNSLDAKTPASDGGQSGVVDGSGYVAGAASKKGASGCGCSVGGHDAGTEWGLAMIVLGLFAFWRGSRSRNRGRRTGQG
jgi:MYXO-CTERM domain-containing protein